MYIPITNEGINTVDHETALLRIIYILMDANSNVSREKRYELLNPGIIRETGNGSFRMGGECMCDSGKVQLEFIRYETGQELSEGDG